MPAPCITLVTLVDTCVHVSSGTCTCTKSIRTNNIRARLLSCTCACLAHARPLRSCLCAGGGEHGGEHAAHNHAAEKALTEVRDRGGREQVGAATDGAGRDDRALGVHTVSKFHNSVV